MTSFVPKEVGGLCKDRSQWRVFVMAVWGPLRYFSLYDQSLHLVTKMKENNSEAMDAAAHVWTLGRHHPVPSNCMNCHNSYYWVEY